MNYYKVGGAVRDEILGKKPKDIDYAVEANSYEDMKNDLLNRGALIFLETPEHGTIRAKLGKIAADFVLARKDGYYSDGRRPDSISVGTIYDDLARRDFTMNSIAKAGDKYLDPHNGIQAIREKLIVTSRTVDEVLTEDSLRMIRAIRFSVTLGFRIGMEIHEFLSAPRHTHLLKNVSEERIYEELKKAFEYDTNRTLHILDLYPTIQDYVFSGNIWLLPTMKGK